MKVHMACAVLTALACGDDPIHWQDDCEVAGWIEGTPTELESSEYADRDVVTVAVKYSPGGGGRKETSTLLGMILNRLGMFT